MGLSNDELIERCRQLNIDCEAAISISESYTKELREISEKTWQNIVTILKKDLKKDQTLRQAYDEFIATGLSKEVLQTIKASTAGLDFGETVESWFSTAVGKPAEGTGMMFVSLGIGVYVKFFAKPGLDTARAANEIAKETLAAFERRMGNISHVLGPNIAAQGAQGQIMFTNNELEAAQEALAKERIANASKGGKAVELGTMWGGLITIGKIISDAIHEKPAEKNTAEEIKRSLHWIYTSRFYMTVQQKYLEFLVYHVRYIEIYAALIAKGAANEGATILESMTSQVVELDPKTNKVNVESIKPFSWSEEEVAADLAKRDRDKGRKTADDPSKEQMMKIHEEQLKKVEEHLKAAAAKPN